MQHKSAIQHHDNHTYKSKQRAQQLYHVDARRMAINQTNQQGSKERTGTYDERCIGSCGIIHRLVLAKEIERTARNAQHRHFKLILPAISKHPLMIYHQHHDICDTEAERKDLCWRKSVQHQHLGRNKGGSPDGYGDEGHKMI